MALSPAWSQEVEQIEVPISNPGEPGYLHLSNHNGTITIKGYNGNSVKVKITSSKDKKDKGKNKYGLKRIDKQASNVSITEDQNEVSINTGNNSRMDFEIEVPMNFSLNLSTHHNGDVEVRNVNGVHEVDSHHGGIALYDVSGTVVADTHHGSIKVTFDQVEKGLPMAFSTYHGNVDITFPSSVRSDLKMKSDKGDIFTDFDFEPVKPEIEHSNKGSKKEIKLSGWTHGRLGGGGEEMLFKTYHGDIIIRKG